MKGDPRQAQMQETAAMVELRKTAAEGEQKEADAHLKRVQAAETQVKMMTGDV